MKTGREASSNWGLKHPPAAVWKVPLRHLAGVSNAESPRPKMLSLQVRLSCKRTNGNRQR